MVCCLNRMIRHRTTSFQKRLFSYVKILFYFLMLIAFFFVIYQYKTNMSTINRIKLLKDNVKTLTITKPKPQQTNHSQYFKDTWQFIGEPNNRQQIFSAYFDSRMEPLVNVNANGLPFGTIRVFAVLTLKPKKLIYCIYRYDDNTEESIDAYESLPVHEHFNMKFSAYIIACPLLNFKYKNVIDLPISVAIAYDEDIRSITNPTFVSIGYPKGNLFSPPNGKIAACIGPLQQNYDEVLRIVEFIEINQLLGIEKFYLYNLKSSGDVRKVLEYYKNKGIIDVINWNFHGYEFENEVRYNGILVAINECLYRATFIDNYKYVAILDFDELLMTFKHSTLLSYINDTINKSNDNTISAFIFRGTFFHKIFMNDFSDIPKNVKLKFLYTQTKIQRTLEPYKAHSRSKYIANARSIIETGSHQIWRSLSKYNEYVVPIEDGLLFHYRTKCLYSSELTCNSTKIIDFSARRFGSLLWNNVDMSCMQIFGNNTCPKSDWII